MGMTGFGFIKFSRTREDKLSASVGGTVHTMTAGANLNLGDVVFVSADKTVNKSAVSASYAGFFGVVVGGRATGFRVIILPNTTGLPAALSGQEVLVQASGNARVVAEGVITAGTTLSVISTGTTAGKVIAGTTAGQMLGVPLTSAISGGEFIMKIDHR